MTLNPFGTVPPAPPALEQITDPAGLPYAADDELVVGQLVEHSWQDVMAGQVLTVVGIVTDITEDGAYVAPLNSAAVVPLDQLRAL